VPGADGVALAPNGDIVVAGSYANSIVTYATVWALTSHGALDGAFGHSGAAVLTNSDQNNTEYAAILLTPTNGDFVAAGDATPFGGSSTGIAARYIGFGAPPPPPPLPLKLSLNGIRRSYKTSTVAKRGLKLTVGCNEACTVKGSLTVSAVEARKLHLRARGNRPVVVASRTLTLRGSGGRRQITLNLSKGDVKALERQKRVPLTLVISATATLTHKGRTLKRSITLRR
jgi:hypothetical protein